MADNRPQGRKVNKRGGSSTVHRRDEGLGIGKVGSGGPPRPGQSGSNHDKGILGDIAGSVITGAIVNAAGNAINNALNNNNSNSGSSSNSSGSNLADSFLNAVNTNTSTSTGTNSVSSGKKNNSFFKYIVIGAIVIMAVVMLIQCMNKDSTNHGIDSYNGLIPGSSQSGTSGSSGSSGTSGSSTSGGVDMNAILAGLSGGNTGGWLDNTAITDSSGGNSQILNTSSINGSLNTTVASGSRGKYTTIYGDGSDKVTLMIYICGADLESEGGMATKDLVEMTNANISDNVNVIVYTGGAKKWQNNTVSNSKNQIYQVVNGGLRTLSTNVGTASMTDPSTLSTFIKAVAQAYPANRYQLILWDHGGGTVTGYGYDEKNKSSGSMSLSGINQALTDANIKFDFIGFDACLMATVENALMLSQHADYLIASEEVEPGIGWYYTNWLTVLSSNPGISTLEVGKKIADDYTSRCNSECRGQATTLSVVDLAEVQNTIPSRFTNFAKSISSLISDGSYKTTWTAGSIRPTAAIRPYPPPEAAPGNIQPATR